MAEAILARGERLEDYPILFSKPELFSDLVWVWEGFLFLSSSRQMGMAGPQPIMLSEVLSYLAFRGIAGDDSEEFLHLVQHLDRLFIAHAIAKDGKPAKPGEAPA